MLSSSAWRLLLLPLVLLAFLLVGAPDFPAFERAIQKAFEKPATPAPTELVAPGPDAPGTRETSGDRQPARHANERSRILLPLYVSFAALQALDAHSTLRALDAGATETNPIMGGLAHTPAALLAVKAGVAVSTIYLVEKVHVKSRAAALVLMAALNSAYAAIVAHNYRVPR